MEAYTKETLKALQAGKIGILATDTLYGVVASAFNKDAVEKIFTIKKRDPSKALIVLISEIKELERFGITPTQEQLRFLEKNWPGPVSIILPCKDANLEYLHRGNNSIAFRVPDKENLRELLEQTGPLVAPSANIEGEPESTTIDQAKAYFGDQIDFYIDEGLIEGNPSKLVGLITDTPEVLRG